MNFIQAFYRQPPEDQIDARIKAHFRHNGDAMLSCFGIQIRHPVGIACVDKGNFGRDAGFGHRMGQKSGQHANGDGRLSAAHQRDQVFL